MNSNNRWGHCPQGRGVKPLATIYSRRGGLRLDSTSVCLSPASRGAFWSRRRPAALAPLERKIRGRLILTSLWFGSGGPRPDSRVSVRGPLLLDALFWVFDPCRSAQGYCGLGLLRFDFYYLAYLRSLWLMAVLLESSLNRMVPASNLVHTKIAL